MGAKKEQLKIGIRLLAKKIIAGIVAGARNLGWNLAHRVASTRWITHNVEGARYISRIPSEYVKLRVPTYQIPSRPLGRYLRGIQRWGLELSSYDAGLLELPGGRFELPECAIGANGRYAEEAYIFKEFPLPWTVHRYAFLFRARAKKVEPGTFLPMLGYKNYYHWIFEIMPRLQLIDGTIWQNRPVYVHEQIPRFAQESLRELPYYIKPLPNGYYTADRLCLPTRLSQIEMSSPAALRWLRRTFLRADPVRTTKGRRLFITREDSVSRKLPQEDIILARLKPFGFERVTLSEMSFQDQIRLFSTAEIVTGPHGAGFANIVWMPRGGALVEITVDTHVGHCFWRICNQLGHRHGFIEAHVSRFTIKFDEDAYFDLVRQAVADMDNALLRNAKIN
jgi:hypothetical protein